MKVYSSGFYYELENHRPEEIRRNYQNMYRKFILVTIFQTKVVKWAW